MELNIRDVDMFINKILDNYNKTYNLAMHVVLLECIKEVGLNKNKIIDNIEKYISDSSLEKLSNSSFMNKAYLKNMIVLDYDSRKDLVKEIVGIINNCDEEDGLLVIPEQPKLIKKAEPVAEPKNIIEINDKDLGIIKFDLAEKEAIITEITEKLSFDVIDEIKFSFKDSGYNSEEFVEDINKFIEVLKEIYKKQDQILKSLYQYAKKIYINWEIKSNIEEITDEYVIKNTKIFNIDIYDNGAYITAELCDEDDDSDDLLGGHGFGLYFNIDDNDFKWSLEG